jgi:DtxR family Mn-dependent transcriptional regulator
MSTFKQTASLEDYLEAIVILNQDGKAATVTAISKSIGVKKPSVEWAINKLSDAGLVVHKPYKDVKLTPEGTKIAHEVYRRHKILRSFLVNVLEIDPDIAEVDACRMEHLLSEESLKQLEKFMDFMLNCHPGNLVWHETFQRYLKYGDEDSELKARFNQ